MSGWDHLAPQPQSIANTPETEESPDTRGADAAYSAEPEPNSGSLFVNASEANDSSNSISRNQ
jgi:hypothetical protein